MSRHEGVSCDSCLKSNFAGRRYKCLSCYDYDLCASCYEAKVTTSRHSIDHPMQCILTRADFEIYFAGDAMDLAQSFTCPYCGTMGFTELLLFEHITSDHSGSTQEVVCPVCASQPGGDPNHLTEELASHMALEHRRTVDSHPGNISNSDLYRLIRRSFRSGRGGVGPRRRQLNSSATTTTTTNVNTVLNSASNSTTGTSLARDFGDPMSELISQLAGVRRNPGQSSVSQLQQIQMHLQFDRQQQRVQQTTRHPMERLSPKRQPLTTPNPTELLVSTGASLETSRPPTPSTSNAKSPFLLTRCFETVQSEADQQANDLVRAERALFVQEMLLSSLMRSPTVKLVVSATDDERVPAPASG